MSIGLQIRRSRGTQEKVAAWLEHKKQTRPKDKWKKNIVHDFIDFCRISHFHKQYNTTNSKSKRKCKATGKRMSECMYVWERERAPLYVTILLSLKEPVIYSSLVWWYAAIMVATTMLMHTYIYMYILYVKKWITYFVNVLNHNENKVKTLFFFKLETLYIFIFIYICIYRISSYLYQWKRKKVYAKEHLPRTLSFVSSFFSFTYSSSCIIICSAIRHCIWRIPCFITRCTAYVCMSVKIKEKGFVMFSFPMIEIIF
jgi:hypothetical protein